MQHLVRDSLPCLVEMFPYLRNCVRLPNAGIYQISFVAVLGVERVEPVYQQAVPRKTDRLALLQTVEADQIRIVGCVWN